MATAYTAEGGWNSLRERDKLAVSYAEMTLAQPPAGLRSLDAAQHEGAADPGSMGPGSASHHHSASKTRVTALMVL